MADLFEKLHNLEISLKIEPGYYEKLLIEDDWSFIIKLHALMEASLVRCLYDAVSTLTSVKYHDSVEPEPESLESYLGWLDMANSQTGKIALAKSFGLLTKLQRQYLRSLSEIRNAFVHNISNVGKSLTEYLSSLNRDKQKKYVNAFSIGLYEPNIKKAYGEQYDLNSFVLAKPKYAIWLSAMLHLILVLQVLDKQRETIQIRDIENEFVCWLRNNASKSQKDTK